MTEAGNSFGDNDMMGNASWSRRLLLLGIVAVITVTAVCAMRFAYASFRNPNASWAVGYTAARYINVCSTLALAFGMGMAFSAGFWTTIPTVRTIIVGLAVLAVACVVANVIRRWDLMDWIDVEQQFAPVLGAALGLVAGKGGFMAGRRAALKRRERRTEGARETEDKLG